jgi:tetratricopeptide (TPR) repeat protein
MNTRILVSALLLCAFTGPALAIPDASGNVTSTPAPDISADAAMQARLNYNLGMESFEKTQAAEKQSATLTGAKAKAAAQATLAGYSEARTRFEIAAKADPDLKEAWNLIGYTSRRLGEYDRSLAAYEKALALNPAYPEAIEYRAEAYLALNRLEDVKTAYVALYGLSPPHAAVLMQSLQGWIAAHRKAHGAVSAADVEALAAWADERAKLAQPTTALRLDTGTFQGWNRSALP